jgi:excisionase family DNA binding protein
MATLAHERKRMLRIGGVAARLDCSETTVRRLIDRGLPVVRLGHRGCSVRFDAAEIEAWIYSNGDGYPVLVHPPAERRVVAARPLEGSPDEAA